MEGAFTPNVVQQQHLSFLSNQGPAVFSMAKILRRQEVEAASTFWLPPFTSRCGCQSRLLRTRTQQSTQLIVTQRVSLCLSGEVPTTSQPSRFSGEHRILCVQDSTSGHRRTYHAAAASRIFQQSVSSTNTANYTTAQHTTDLFCW